MPYPIDFTLGEAGLAYDPNALRRAQQARQQRQTFLDQVTQAGQPLYGSNFRLNQMGAPIFGPTTGSPWQSEWFYQNPSSAVTQRLAEMGMTTWETNPFVSYALNIAGGLRNLYDIVSPLMGQAGDLLGFTAFSQQIPQIMLGTRQRLEASPFSRRMVSQALRNFAPGRALSLDEEVGIVRDLIQNIGSLWMTPTWRKIALADLNQKVDDYVRYMASSGGYAPTFIEFLVQTGFVDRYFGQ